MKNILGVLTGALLMGVAMAIVAYALTGFGATFLWQAGVVFFAGYGTVNGSITGAVIINYNLNFIRGAIFGLLFNIAIGIAFLIFTMGKVENEFYSDYYVSIIIGTFNGATISLFNRLEYRLK
jgi:hypothetical protein